MVGNHAHGDVGFFVGSIPDTTQCCYFPDNGLENIGIVVRLFALNGHAQTFEAHPGIDYLSRKRFERSIGLSVVLHKYIVPDLNYLRMTPIH